MNNLNRRTYEMLSLIVIFATAYPQYFQEGSVTAKFIELIQAALTELTRHATTQASGKGEVRRSSQGRGPHRSALKSVLEKMSRTARALQLPAFWMPRNRGDRAFLAVGKVFLKNGQPLRKAVSRRTHARGFPGRGAAPRGDYSLNRRIARVTAKLNRHLGDSIGIHWISTALSQLQPVRRNFKAPIAIAAGIWLLDS